MIGTTGKVLLYAGIGIALAGLLLMLADRPGWLHDLVSRLPLGRLPGDIRYKGEGFSFYFPWVSCLVVSVALSLVLWLLRK